MFILAYFVIVILRANHIVVPDWISFWVGLIAILEAALYIFLIIINILAVIVGARKF